jgi:hypothetical protein
MRVVPVALLVSGCASAQFEESAGAVPVVPVDKVINALKCGLAEAVTRDPRRRTGLYGSTAKVELDVNVVQGVDASGNISVGVPVYQGSFAPGFAFSRTETRTLNSSIDFDISVVAQDTSICWAGVERGRDAGFSTWIGAVVTSVNAAVAGPPKASMQQYVYESDFTVKTGAGLGLEADIVPVKFNSSIGSSRSDIQHMKVTIQAVRVVRAKDGREVVTPGAGPFFRGVEKSDRERRGTFNLDVP